MIFGVLLLGYSRTLKPYTNETEYNEAYNDLEGENKTEKFYELGHTYLTNKYALENYGATSLILGMFSFFLFFNNWENFKIPKK